MKILQLVTKRQYRGAEVFAYNLSKQLTAQNHRIIFAGLYKNTEKPLAVPEAVNLDLITEKPRFISIKLLKNLIKLIKKENPDIIQCNGSDTLKYAVIASFFTNTPPIVYRNISMMSQWLNSPVKKMIYRFLFKHVDFVTSVGTYAAKDLSDVLHYPAEKVKVIRRGIPVSKIDKQKARENLRNTLQIPENHKVLIHIGNFSPEKNHIFLLDVFELLLQEYPDTTLLLVGKGELLPEIKKEIIKRNLQEKVKVLGFRQDTPELLAASDLFVLTSKVEGVPGVILEAAMQKVPAVATNVGGVQEVLKDNQTGKLIYGFDKTAFKIAIKTLLENPEERRVLGENAYKNVIKNFNNSQTGQAFEELYHHLQTNNQT